MRNDFVDHADFEVESDRAVDGGACHLANEVSRQKLEVANCLGITTEHSAMRQLLQALHFLPVGRLSRLLDRRSPSESVS